VVGADDTDGRSIALVATQGLAFVFAVIARFLGVGVVLGGDENRGREGQEDGDEELHCSCWSVGCLRCGLIVLNIVVCRVEGEDL
jgi:hypothetical protein